jgi:hypothetical protein
MICGRLTWAIADGLRGKKPIPAKTGMLVAIHLRESLNHVTVTWQIFIGWTKEEEDLMVGEPNRLTGE